MLNTIKKNLLTIQDNIKKACDGIGRDPSEILLIGVTKTIATPQMQTLLSLGVTDFGENKVQEIVTKVDQFEKSVQWHLIGHLQTNKVKYIIDKVKMIHSLDSLKLANEINKRASEHNLVMDVLVEVNIANESSKHGILQEEVLPFVTSLGAFSHLRVCGLMTVAPYVDLPEQNRDHFKKMKQLLDGLQSLQITNLQPKYLSMGMTNDYEVAISEGANMIRIGTGIFGERNY